MTNVITDLGNAAKRDDLPEFRAGDTVKVHVKVTEGTRSRVQIFQGVVIRDQGSGIGTGVPRADGPPYLPSLCRTRIGVGSAR